MAMEWKGKNVVIVGAARQGLALAGYLLAQGAQVTLTDQRPLSESGIGPPDRWLLNRRMPLPSEWVCGDHPLSLLEGADLLCLSGGVSPGIPLAQAAQQRGLPLSNDSQIFMEVAPCRVIGITGSAGKTTTTTLVGRIAQAAAATAPPRTGSPGWLSQGLGGREHRRPLDFRCGPDAGRTTCA